MLASGVSTSHWARQEVKNVKIAIFAEQKILENLEFFFETIYGIRLLQQYFLHSIKT